MISQKVLYKKIVHHVSKDEFLEARHFLLRALDQLYKEDGWLFPYLGEINQQYHLLLFPDEVKRKYGPLLNSGFPTLRQFEQYYGYENYLEEDSAN